MVDIPLYTSKINYLKSINAGDEAIRCLIAADYNENITMGTPLKILTNEEFELIKKEQLLISTPTIISSYIIDKTMRTSRFSNINEKKAALDNAAILFNENPAYSLGNIIPELANVCSENPLKNTPFNGENFMNSVAEIKADSFLSDSRLEVKIAQEEGMNEAFIDHIYLSEIDTEIISNNNLTVDLVDNIVFKNMFLNKVFSWNGDNNSFLSIHSFKRGEFVSLYEGLALYYADQQFNSRNKATNCNPATLSNCSYPENYGEYGLLISYLLSDVTDELRNEKKSKMIEFIDNLELYNTNGCGVEWSTVSYKQREMSNICIEKAFNETQFTDVSNTVLSWNDIKNNWTTIKNDYVGNINYTSKKHINETIQ